MIKCCVVEMLDTTFLELLRCQVTEFLVLRRTQCQVWPLSTCGVCWGGRGGFGVVVTPTHSHRGAVAEEVESSAGTIFRHPAAQHSTTIAARLQTSGGWEVGAVVGTKCRGVLSMWTVVHPPSTRHPPRHTAQYTVHGTSSPAATAVPRRAEVPARRPGGGEHSCGLRGWRGENFAGYKCKLVATF